VYTPGVTDTRPFGASSGSDPIGAFCDVTIAVGDLLPPRAGARAAVMARE
jgi:hypothetical protein